MTNWERKSAYLLKEIVKFRTYIEALNQARTAQNKINEEREQQRKLDDNNNQGDPGGDLEKDEDDLEAVDNKAQAPFPNNSTFAHDERPLPLSASEPS